MQLRRFDLCIVDECSQILESAAIASLAVADKFLLLGDDMQLSPMVKSHDAMLVARVVSSHGYFDVGRGGNFR